MKNHHLPLLQKMDCIVGSLIISLPIIMMFLQLNLSYATSAFTIHSSFAKRQLKVSSQPSTICHAKLNKLASSFDLDEILSKEKQFTSSAAGESKSKRKRTSSKDMKRQKLKEVLDKNKGIPSPKSPDIDAGLKTIKHDALLSSLHYELHQVHSTEEGKRIDGLLAQLINANIDGDAAISRSQCGSLLSSGCVFVVPRESASDIQSEEGTKLSYSRFREVGVPIDKKSYLLEQSSLLIYPTRQSILSTASLLSNVAPTEIIPQKLPLDILYEDECMIVINKEAGMVVHPAAGNWDGTVVNALSYYLMNESPFGAGEFFGAVNNEKVTEDVSMSDNDNYLFDDLDDDNMDDDMDDTINQNDAVTNSISSLRPGIVHRLDKGTTGKNCIQS
jgi:23S rRNA-/tRNA-specific pseudouridylate synthase